MEIMLDTLNEILGKRADKELSDRIKEILTEEEDVRGAYDLIINNYGPDKNIASVHLELPDVMTVEEVDQLARRVEARVYKETGVALTGIGVYSYNTKDKKASEIREAISRKVMSHNWALQMHGFHCDTAEKKIRFDVVFSFDIETKEGLPILYSEVCEMYPDYQVIITPDLDLTD